MNIDEKRFRELFDTERSVIYGIAYKNGIPYDEIEDILMETFTRFMERYPDPMPDQDTHRVIVRIAYNLCMDYFRENGRHPTDYLEPEKLEAEILSRRKHWEYQPEEAAEGHQLEQDLAAGLRSLRPIYYQSFVLMAIQGRSIEEVSGMLGISKANCRERLYRARNQLADYLTEHSNVWITRLKKGKHSVNVRLLNENDEDASEP